MPCTYSGVVTNCINYKESWFTLQLDSLFGKQHIISSDYIEANDVHVYGFTECGGRYLGFVVTY